MLKGYYRVLIVLTHLDLIRDMWVLLERAAIPLYLTCMPASKIHRNNFPLSLTPVCILFYACLPYIWSQAWKEVAVDKGLKKTFSLLALGLHREDWPLFLLGEQHVK